MGRFLFLVSIALLAAVPAIASRMLGWRAGPVVDAAIFGIAILAAGFLLSWSAEAAEQRISQGLILAAVALVTVLPEYAVDIYYAYQAGRAGPASPYVHYAAANMTGSNRLLVGVAWPLIVLLHWIKDRHRSVELASANAVEIGFLLLASLYAFGILYRGRITLLDLVFLVAIFGGSVWRVGQVSKIDDRNEAEETGPAAVLQALSRGAQWATMCVLFVVACGVILASAEPFAEAIVGTGRAIGINEFLLIQWLAPLASEAPTVTVAVLLVLAARAGNALTMMISEKINQWTLLVGMLPLAVSIGAGSVSPLPFDARQSEEFFLTAAQSVFGITLLLRLRLGIVGAVALVVLFTVQVGLAFVYRNDEARTIATLTALGWTYLGLTIVLAFVRKQELVAVVRSAFLPPHSERTSR